MSMSEKQARRAYHRAVKRERRAFGAWQKRWMSQPGGLEGFSTRNLMLLNGLYQKSLAARERLIALVNRPAP